MVMLTMNEKIFTYVLLNEGEEKFFFPNTFKYASVKKPKAGDYFHFYDENNQLIAIGFPRYMTDEQKIRVFNNTKMLLDGIYED